MAVVHMRKIEGQVNLVSSPSLESYLGDRFQMGTKKVRGSLDSVLKWKAGTWNRAPG